MKKLCYLFLVFGLAVPAASMAQTTTITVFSDTFGAGSTVDQAPTTPTSTSTSYEFMGSSTTSGTASISVGHLTLSPPSSATTFFGQVQARLPAAQLLTVGDVLDLLITFTGSNILSGTTTNSSLNMGFYNSGGTFPQQGYAATTGSFSPSTGNAQNWVGYVGRAIGNSGGSIFSRAVQTGTTGQNQDLLFSGASSSTAFNSPTGTNLTTSGSSNTAIMPQDVATQITAELRVTLSATDTLSLGYFLYSGSNTSGTQLFARSGSTTNIVTTTFDGFAIGWRQNVASITSMMDVNSITLNKVTLVPEPTVWAMMVAGAGMLIGWRRFRRR